ncbi:MAG: ATP phosphoribosyltransferase regulatory subunit [Clostridia bacterium]|nr:ATP phosphoribosyltransferase regulatory subunit [Clostridia bacterium]
MSKVFGIPSNTGDLLFCECESRRELERRILKLFSEYGYNEIITPTLEYYELFIKNKSFNDDEMFKLTDSKNRLVVLRPDSTVPVGRIISTKLKGAAFPLRLCYDQNVFRANSLFSLKRDEITECGIELVGIGGIRADVEALTLAVKAIKKAVRGGFKLEIGTANYFDALADELSLSESEKDKIRGIIADKNFALLDTELEKYGDKARELREMPKRFGDISVIDGAIKSAPNEKAKDALLYLSVVCKKLAELGYGDVIMVDLGLVNKIDYYTGIVFRGYIESQGEAVLSGGRYDSLFEEEGVFLPAVGFSMNIDAVNSVICKAPAVKVPDAVIFYADGFEKDAFELFASLKSEKISAELSVFDSLASTAAYCKKIKAKTLYSVTESGVKEESF